MEIAGSPDILQAKMMELMATLEFVRAYSDDLLSTTKGTPEGYLAKLELVLSRLQDANLKIMLANQTSVLQKQNTLGTSSQEMESNLNPRRYS